MIRPLRSERIWLRQEPTRMNMIPGSTSLCALDKDEVATVEYWLYLEGCDEQCSNPVQNKASEIRLAFAGVDAEEKQQ